MPSERATSGLLHALLVTMAAVSALAARTTLLTTLRVTRSFIRSIRIAAPLSMVK
jgi:hypothetical protein